MTGLRTRRVIRHAKNNIFVTILVWVVAISIVIWVIWSQNNLLMTDSKVYSANYLPKSLVGTRIVHISDINNVNMTKIIKKVKEFDPNFVLISGGYTDTRGKYDHSKEIITELAKITKVMYVYNELDGTEDFLSGTGAENITGKTVVYTAPSKSAEEFISNVYGDEIIKKANNKDEKSLKYIEYTKEALKESEGATIAISGIDVFSGDNGGTQALKFLNSATANSQADYHIAIMGDIKLVDSVAKSRVDLVFTGGTYGVNKKDERFKKGEYNINGTEIMVCGGIGTDGETKRVFNFPEIQCITLSDGTITNYNPLEKFFKLFVDDVDTIFKNDGGFHEYTYKYGSN